MSKLINGKMLETNLLRGGVDLAVETDMLYVDVTNGRIGIQNATPTVELDVTGAVKSTTAAIGNITLATNTVSTASAGLIFSSTSGLVSVTGAEAQLGMPTHTTAQITAIGTPVEGATVYDTTTKQLKFYDGTVWTSTGTGGGIATYVLTAATTDATQTEALTETSGRLSLPDNSTWRFEANIVARRTDATDESAGYKFTGVINRQTGVATTAIVGIVAEVIDADDDASWFITVDADTTYGSLRVQVTGAASADISWVAFIRTVEVSN